MRPDSRFSAPRQDTVREDNRFSARNRRAIYPCWDTERFASLTDGNGVLGSRRIRELSRGMGVKLQLAASLSHDVLILDEPTSGLDPFARDELLRRLADFMTEESHSVLFSTHITTDLERIADYVTILDHGRVLHAAAKDDLVASYLLAAGGPDDRLDAASMGLIGLRRHGTGWDALIHTRDAHRLSQVQLEPPTLDDLVVRLAQEHCHD